MPPQSFPKPRGRAPFLLTAAAVFSIVMPALVWQQTWFGRRLSERQLGEYLAGKKERRIQHALTQISHRIAARDAGVSQWYPRVASLAAHPVPAIRITSAWVMGQDNRSDLFHRTLLGLLDDPDAMVRRNAALGLVRFRDASGRQELLAMLRPYVFRAGSPGRVAVTVVPGQKIGAGTLVARIGESDSAAEVRSPFAGAVASVEARDGSRAKPGDPLATLDPGREQIWEALRALYLIGNPDDLTEVARFETAAATDDLTRYQARLTAQAIRARTAP